MRRLSWLRVLFFVSGLCVSLDCVPVVSGDEGGGYLVHPSPISSAPQSFGIGRGPLRGDASLANFLEQVSSSVNPPEDRRRQESPPLQPLIDPEAAATPGENSAASPSSGPETADQDSDEESYHDDGDHHHHHDHHHDDGGDSSGGGSYYEQSEDDEDGGSGGEGSGGGGGDHHHSDEGDSDDEGDSHHHEEYEDHPTQGVAQETQALPQYALPPEGVSVASAPPPTTAPLPSSIDSFLNFSNAISGLTHANLTVPLGAGSDHNGSESSIIYKTATGDLDTAATGYGGHGHG